MVLMVVCYGVNGGELVKNLMVLVLLMGVGSVSCLMVLIMVLVS